MKLRRLNIVNIVGNRRKLKYMWFYGRIDPNPPDNSNLWPANKKNAVFVFYGKEAC
jgi:hypothetical protein